MDVIKARGRDSQSVIPLLQQAAAREGKSFSSQHIKRLLKSFEGQRELFVVKGGGKVMGCVSVKMQDGEAELDHFAVAQEADQGYEKVLLERVMEHCLQHEATVISSVIPRAYEQLFIQHGFFVNDRKVCVELKRVEGEQQRDLRATLQDLAAVEDIAGKTAEKLRKLRTRGPQKV